MERRERVDMSPPTSSPHDATDSEIPKMTLYEDRRQLVKLSVQCWDCLDAIKDVSYSNAYTFFWPDQLKLVQQAIRKIAPDIKGDWLRFHFEGKTVTFSLSDGAVSSYKPKIQEFSAFGSAVKILGSYEAYVRQIAQLSSSTIPSDMEAFRNRHKKHVSRTTNALVKSELGRGIDFFQEVFGYDADRSFRPSLEFLYQLRNVAVHNSGIADQRLCDMAKNPHITITGGTLKVGMKLHWNLSWVLQLQHLLTGSLPQVDPLVSAKLSLPQIEKRAYWYLESSE
jgi:hypothetical protein